MVRVGRVLLAVPALVQGPHPCRASGSATGRPDPPAPHSGGLGLAFSE